jgi:bifunctional non-homologous end joining protein LigD
VSGLDEYRRKRDPERTPEPIPDDARPTGSDDTFVIQEHHATSLHWDVRLERGGVLVSWAVPRGLPWEPGTIRLAVHTEDHPMEYSTFEGEIPRGEYGGGRMFVWDRGRYETEKWTDREVAVVLHGSRVRGRYVFFHGGKDPRDWMVRRSDPPHDPGWQPLPESVEPMLATPGELPDGDGWAYEFAWGGLRAQARVDGGRVRMSTAAGDVTAACPELRALGRRLGSTLAVLDGELVALRDGRPSAEALRSRMQVGDSRKARRLAEQLPMTYLIFDVLHLDGRSCLQLPYASRRELLEALVPDGPHWQVSPSFPGDGALVLRAATEQSLDGVVAKRVDSPYLPGGRGADWIAVDGHRHEPDRTRG